MVAIVLKPIIEWLIKVTAAPKQSKYQHLVAFENFAYLHNTLQTIAFASPGHASYLEQGLGALKKQMDANLDGYVDSTLFYILPQTLKPAL